MATRYKFCLLVFTAVILIHPTRAIQLTFLQYENILKESYESCVVAIPDTLTDAKALSRLSSAVETSFRNEPEVMFYRVDFSRFKPSASTDAIDSSSSENKMLDIDYEHSFLIFKRLREDRTCLLSSPRSAALEPQVYSFVAETDYSLDKMILFINDICLTFRKSNGNLTHKGMHKEYLLENLFSVMAATATGENNLNKNNNRYTPSSHSETVCTSNPNDMTENDCATHHGRLEGGDNEESASTSAKSEEGELNGKNMMQRCERIPMPTTPEFFNNYLSISKPVIITGATSEWPVFKKWTNQFFQEQYGDIKVHVKITPNGEYEGVEETHLWDSKFKIKIPKSVLAKLPFPDLVVVRPASMEILFSDFVNLIQNISLSESSHFSAYLEYSSVSYFPNLKTDIPEMSFIEGILNLKHTNIWLSDGNTVGKLHFDEYDNFMSQISGEKEFIIYEPHDNERLYEAHIQQAMLSYNASSKSFSRHKFLKSTSMVMSPVDIEKPDLQRFPKFSEAVPMSCTIKPGDVLFMPAFWWHEVRSKPSTSEHRNLAVNFWYDPFFLKEFPCQECKLYMNPKYFHLL